ncbi:auxin-responsive protein SAUR72-like [Alnus glutinosa]|jgi:SAUR family protein|uniref:auxin-responsive protein SAUR72-like n=1 Tax=Alnus glutinosa TaxID=3517 RepID=UPI002D7A18F3|nr:auxin-responsive protein SAUR72-like [Alnus glutinosa]
MDIVKEKWKKNLIVKTWDRCRSRGGGGRSKSNSFMTKSKSWNCTTTMPANQQEHKSKRAPEGCFSVYVGPEKQRFVVKTEFANHPLFKMLLEDAELEYGYNSQGPILLPCEVDLFYKVLAEMDGCDDRDQFIPAGCNFPCSPVNRRSNSSGNKAYGAYRLLSPSRMLKMNHF